MNRIPNHLKRGFYRCKRSYSIVDKYWQPESGKSKIKNSIVSNYFLGAIITSIAAANLYFLWEHSQKPKRNILLPNEFSECDILSVEQVSPTTKFYKIKAKSSNRPIPFHVTIKDDSCQVGRHYTPVTHTDDEIGLLIKNYPGGVISSMMNKMEAGDLVHIRGPTETMPPYVGGAKKIVMIAGGTGVTPFYQLIKHVLSRDEGTELVLYYCNRRSDDILLKRELDLLPIKVVYALDYPNSDGIKEKTLNPKTIGDLVVDSSVVLVCGPDGFVEKVAGKTDGAMQGPIGGILKQLGVDSNKVYKLY